MHSGWTIIAHGGAKNIAPEDEHANRAGIHAALVCGRAILEQGGHALDAVVQEVLDRNPALDFEPRLFLSANASAYRPHQPGHNKRGGGAGFQSGPSGAASLPF